MSAIAFETKRTYSFSKEYVTKHGKVEKLKLNAEIDIAGKSVNILQHDGTKLTFPEIVDLNAFDACIDILKDISQLASSFFGKDA